MLLDTVNSPISTIFSETSSGFFQLTHAGYLLLTVQRRSLKSTLPAQKGQLWVSWLLRFLRFVATNGRVLVSGHISQGELVVFFLLNVRIHLSRKTAEADNEFLQAD